MKKIKKTVAMIFVFVIAMSTVNCFALPISPRYIPTEVNMTFWDNDYYEQISSINEDVTFAIKLDLGGGTGTYEISIDFGDGHTLHESSFTGYTFITTYNYHTPGTKTIDVEVHSIDTVSESKDILVTKVTE
jgi:hypothetical protein